MLELSIAKKQVKSIYKELVLQFTKSYDYLFIKKRAKSTYKELAIYFYQELTLYMYL